MGRYAVLVVIISCTLVTSVPVKQYRKDYVYNKKTNAFYKLHIESTRAWQAREVCKEEGAKLMLPISPVDISQLHGMFKKYPDLGEYVRVESDGQQRESAEEEQRINLETEHIDESEAGYSISCEVVTRRGKIETYPCYRQLPFMCKVEARDAFYDEQCDVYAKGYQYISNGTVSSCYRVSTVAFTWNGAFADCDAENAHLVILNSPTEQHVVKKLLDEAPSVSGTLAGWFYFAGFRADDVRTGETKQFRTVFNQTLEEAGFNIWADGEPNNSLSENCGSIFRNNGRLNDLYCNQLYGFVCEKETAPRAS